MNPDAPVTKQFIRSVVRALKIGKNVADENPNRRVPELMDGSEVSQHIVRGRPGATGASRRLRNSLDMFNKTAARRKLTRKEQRDLDVEIGFMEGIVRRDPKCFEAWRVLSDDYSRRGKFEKCLQADEELARMAPDDPAVLYDLACSYSLNKRVEQSLAALSCAVARGFRDFRLLLRDPDLVNLRRDPLFKKVWEKICTFQSGTA